MQPSTLILYLLPLLAEAAPHSRNAQQQQSAAMMGCGQQGQQQQKGKGQQGQQQKAGAKVGKAIYMITNDAQNAVVAIPIGADGKLSAGKMAKTGGAGSIAVDADGKPATPDALVGQSALTVVGNVSPSHIIFTQAISIWECKTKTPGPS